MNKMPPARLLAGLLACSLLIAAPVAPAFAQETGTRAGGLNGPLPPAPDLIAPNSGPDQPAPLTGELVPIPPGVPPEGAAADIKLPDCAPPNCGTPEIMAE